MTTRISSVPPSARKWCADCMGTGWLHNAHCAYRCACSMPKADHREDVTRNLRGAS